MIVISTTINDIHAATVAAGLEELAVPYVRWINSDFPSAQWASISLEMGKDDSIRFFDKSGTDWALKSDVVLWNRRISAEAVPPEGIHPADRGIAARESLSFIENFATILGSKLHAVNDLHRARRAENKSLQLSQAKNIGLSIPKTLISNDPKEIRDFIRSHDGEKVIAKPFRPHVWRSEEVDRVSHSAVVTLEDLPSEESLRSCPMIFQKYINKAIEARINYLGGEIIAAQLDPHTQASELVDWRSISPSKLDVKPLAVPPSVQSLCANLMRTLGLEFGCIDAIVTPAGEWVFLELNQMGQFMWIEEVNPQIKIMSSFIKFICSKLDISGPELNSKIDGLDIQKLKENAVNLLRKEESSRVKKPVRNMFSE